MYFFNLGMYIGFWVCIYKYDDVFVWVVYVKKNYFWYRKLVFDPKDESFEMLWTIIILPFVDRSLSNLTLEK